MAHDVDGGASPAELRAAAEGVFRAQGIELNEAALQKSLEQLGFDSLHAVELQLALEQALGVALDDDDRVHKSYHTMPLADFLAHVVRRAQSKAT